MTTRLSDLPTEIGTTMSFDPYEQRYDCSEIQNLVHLPSLSVAHRRHRDVFFNITNPAKGTYIYIQFTALLSSNEKIFVNNKAVSPKL